MLITPAMRLRILGDFSLLADGRQMSSVVTARPRALLTYLALRRDAPQQRAHIAFLFWPETTEAQARNNLRQTLHQLRQALPEIERLLTIDARTLQWNPDAPCDLDIAEFEAALAQAEASARGDDTRRLRGALEAADRAYGGDLLPDCFDEWILPERERLRQRHMQALERLLRALEDEGDTRAAIPCAQRLLTLDPLSEDLYRRLMSLFARNDDRASALHVYHTCVSTLQREMGVTPSPATRAVYERLLNQEMAADATTEAAATLAPDPTTRRALPNAAPALTGREREWERLRAAWRHVNQSGPHVVFITGEAGVGKSRLTEEFLRWVSEQGGVTAKARSYATEGQLSFAPVTDWLRSEGFRGPLRLLGAVWLSELARLLPELLSEQPELPRYEPMTEYGQRQRFFEALARAVLTAPQPIALALDDMQWLDQDTLAWLHLLLRFEPRARLLIVGCARQENLAAQQALQALLLQLRGDGVVTEIALEPLDAAETARLAAQVVGRDLETNEALRLFHETGGYPLFVVEMLRANPEPITARTQSSSQPSSQATLERARNLPPRMYAVLAGRLMQLSPSARTLAEQAATIGRAFTLDLLCAIGPTETESAARALDELWRKRIVRELDANTYDFTHDKLREVAYAELGAPQRSLLHRQVARALETLYVGDLAPVSGELAAHYERAGMIEQAISAYQRAANAAQAIYATEDAISLLLRSLELLHTLPAGSQRDRRELALQLALAPLYRMTRGWTAPELERALDGALALCDTVGDDEQRAQTLFGLQSVYVVQARLDRVQTLSEELRALYQRSLGGAEPPFADMMLAGARLHQGYIGEASERLAAIIAASDPARLLQLQESQGTNYAAHTMAWRAHALWLLGYPQQALDSGLEAVKLVRDLNQPFNQALVSAYLALTQQLRAPRAIARASAEEAYALTNTYQALYYRNWAQILMTYAHALEQPDERHIAQVEEAITIFMALGAKLRLPYYLALLAEVYGKAERPTEGLAAVERGLAHARAYNERWWDAELHRLRGELLLLRGAEVGEAEAAFLRAGEIARAQRAKALELRAALSLARLWRDTGRASEARRRLASVYAWFTEGFDTPDLRDAQELLRTL